MFDDVMTNPQKVIDDAEALRRKRAEEEARKKAAMTTLSDGDWLRSQTKAGILNAQNRVAPQSGYTTIAPVAQGAGATINMSPQDAWRQRQLALAGRLEGVLNGTQMGAGEMAARREGNRAIAQQQSFARSQRGGNAALAARGAATNAANIGLNTVGQAAQARASDQQMATQTMAGLLEQGRGADIGLATGQAGLTQQQGLANMDARNQAIFQQAGLNQATSLANMQARLQQTGMNDQAILAYLSQLYGVSSTELQARLQYEQIRQGGQASKNQLLGQALTVGGTIIGGIYGGPAGAAAGGAAGSAIGGKVSGGSTTSYDPGASPNLGVTPLEAPKYPGT